LGADVIFFGIEIKGELGVFKGGKIKPFKVVATIVETLNMEPHDNDKKKCFEI
jgi:hypothetical protein